MTDIAASGEGRGDLVAQVAFPFPVIVSAAMSELTIASSVASMAAQKSSVMWSSSSMVSAW